MLIKKYVVNNMNEAMAKIRSELGKDAVIISQKKVRKSGIIGFFSGKLIEVTAAVESANKDFKDDNKQVSKPKVNLNKNQYEEPAREESLQALTNLLKDVTNNDSNIKNNVIRKQDVKEEIKEKEESDIHRDVKEMKEALNRLIQGESITGTPKQDEKNSLDKLLREYDLNNEVISYIDNYISNLDDTIEINEKIKAAIDSIVSTPEENKRNRIKVLVGPTGVGKTTTIAKLSGRLALMEKKKVGLITIDTYRIGAVEQLKTYANIMNLPFKVVFTLKEMESAIESMQDCDVILIDTTGRSSKNVMQISELRAFVERTGSEDIYLVVSCTTKNKDLKEIVEGFRILRYNNIIVTKLDETCSYGAVINILYDTQKPLAFVTTGQNVPNDIKALNKNEISDLILGGEDL
jgi:flagellar biosynthesis protein FlhF